MEGINTPFVIDEHTAIVMTDPQNDFLSENGLGWGAFGEWLSSPKLLPQRERATRGIQPGGERAQSGIHI